MNRNADLLLAAVAAHNAEDALDGLRGVWSDVVSFLDTSEGTEFLRRCNELQPDQQARLTAWLAAAPSHDPVSWAEAEVPPYVRAEREADLATANRLFGDLEAPDLVDRVRAALTESRVPHAQCESWAVLLATVLDAVRDVRAVRRVLDGEVRLDVLAGMGAYLTQHALDGATDLVDARVSVEVARERVAFRSGRRRIRVEDVAEAVSIRSGLDVRVCKLLVAAVALALPAHAAALPGVFVEISEAGISLAIGEEEPSKQGRSGPDQERRIAAGSL